MPLACKGHADLRGVGAGIQPDGVRLRVGDIVDERP